MTQSKQEEMENIPMTVRVLHDSNFETLADKSVDMVLTDPPFNISRKSNFHTYEKNTIHSYQFDSDQEEQWDTYSHDEFLVKLDDWAREFERVLRAGGNFAVFCADAYISHLMEALKRNKLSPRRLITWRKSNAVPINRAYMPTSANEYIIVGVKGSKAVFNADVAITEQTLDQKTIEATLVADKASAVLFSHLRKAVLLHQDADGATADEHLDSIRDIVEGTFASTVKEAAQKVDNMYKVGKKTGEKYLQACVPNYIQSPLKTGKRIHPTEKPTAVLEYLVALYTKPGETILDPFAGSGSTGEAAVALDRNVILVERDKKFYDAICHRLPTSNENDN